MSSILDALNRSEKERSKTGSSGPEAKPSLATNHRPHARRILVIGALLVVSAVAFGWVWRDSIASHVNRLVGGSTGEVSDSDLQQLTDTSGNKPKAARPKASGNRPNKAAGKQAPAKQTASGDKRNQDRPKQPANAGGDAAMTAAEKKAARIAERQAHFKQKRRENKARRNQESAEIAPETTLVANEAGRPNGLRESSQQAADVKPDSGRSKTVAIGASPQAQSGLQPETSVEPAINTTTDVSEPDSQASRYTMVHELPLGVRVKLPEIQLNMHVYHQNPGSRFVMINMRRFQVGDTMEELDVKVSGIEPEGVVLQFQGHEFLLPNG